MATKDTITVSVTLRNGQCFEHHPPDEPREYKLKFVSDIAQELNKERSGILTLTHPMGIYRMDDISSIHFLDIEPDAKSQSIGFVQNGRN